MNTKQIGKIQVNAGIILLLITILGSIFVIKVVYFNGLINSNSDVTQEWAESLEYINATNVALLPHVVAYLAMTGLNFKMSISIFIVCTLILATLSIILITQGLVNLNKK